MPEPEATTAEPQAAEAQPEPKSVGPLTELQDTLSSAWGVPALNGSEAAPEPPAREDSPAGSADDPSSSALKPGDALRSPEDQAGDEPKPEESSPPKPSRRQEEEEKRQAEIRAAIDAHEREKDARVKAEQDAANARAEIQQADNAAMAALGTDDEFNRLLRIRTHGPRQGEYLSADEDDKLNRLIEYRELGASFLRIADVHLRRQQTAQALAQADKYGLDKSRLDPTSPNPPALPEIIEHAITATEARVRGEFEPQLAERDRQIADLEAENEGLRARAVGRSRAPMAVNGRSAVAAAGPGDYDDSRSPLDNLRDVLSVKIPGG